MLDLLALHEALDTLAAKDPRKAELVRLGQNISSRSAGMAYLEQGRWQEVLPHLEQALEQCRANLGAEHPVTLGTVCILADAYKQAARWDEAVALLEPVLALGNTKGARSHPETLSTMQHLAAIYRAAGKLDKAIPLLEETLKLRKSVLPSGHPDVLNTIRCSNGNATWREPSWTPDTRQHSNLCFYLLSCMSSAASMPRRNRCCGSCSTRSPSTLPPGMALGSCVWHKATSRVTSAAAMN